MGMEECASSAVSWGSAALDTPSQWGWLPSSFPQLSNGLTGWTLDTFKAFKGHLLLMSESLTPRKIQTFIEMSRRPSSGSSQMARHLSHCNSSNLLSLNFKQYRQACFCVHEQTTGFLATIAALAAESTSGSGLEDVKPHLTLPLQPSLLLLMLIFLARAACAEGRGTKHSAF